MLFRPRKSLICIKPKQTLTKINTCILLTAELKLERKIKVRVEPGIFEWTKWETGKTTPALMTLEELKEANFNVSTEYRYALLTASALGFLILVTDGKEGPLQ